LEGVLARDVSHDAMTTRNIRLEIGKASEKIKATFNKRLDKGKPDQDKREDAKALVQNGLV